MPELLEVRDLRKVFRGRGGHADVVRHDHHRHLGVELISESLLNLHLRRKRNQGVSGAPSGLPLNRDIGQGPTKLRKANHEL